MNRNRGLVTMLNRPNDVFRPEGSVTAKKHTIPCRLMSCFIDDGHIPLVKSNSNIPLYPLKSIFLPNREYHVVTGKKFFSDDFRFKVTSGIFTVL